MHTRRHTLKISAIVALSLGTGFGPGVAASAGSPPIGVVASFSILGDMVKTVGGDRVRVTTLVGPDADAHAFEPAPGAAQAIASAAVVFVNGLGLEQGWIPRLVQAAGFKGSVVVTTAGIEPLEMAEEEEEEDPGKLSATPRDRGKPNMVDDPHAWQNLADGRFYVRNIVAGLSAADPAGAPLYEANGRAYLSEIDALDAEVKTNLEAIPRASRKIVTTHDAFRYFGDAYGIEFLAPEGTSTEAEPSAGQVAKLIRQIRSEKVTAVFFENMSDNRLLARISKETGARIGGTVYSDALSGPDGPAATYLAMFRHNLREFTRALAGS